MRDYIFEKVKDTTRFIKFGNVPVLQRDDLPADIDGQAIFRSIEDVIPSSPYIITQFYLTVKKIIFYGELVFLICDQEPHSFFYERAWLQQYALQHDEQLH